ncbi:hypothetical protein HO133_002532 [Letharia lupina]|uniref:Uncharacterized protein n=1 Tax=Letharia lupina TaxID=560253 RepID=A0A8H6FA16_9LECA|nr:uncharacterized protein HO133_002532 [Letharia lupina]KAF6220852.1 hypothetical protein HO133_002532 [Letharia lupina]
MAKAVEDDAALLATSTPLPLIDDATFARLALLCHAPPTALNSLEPASQPQYTNPTLPMIAEGQKRAEHKDN